MLPEAGARPPEFFAGQILERAPVFGLVFDPHTVELLSRYLAELDRTRRKTNLTGPMPSSGLVDHVLESVLGSSLIPHGARVLDVGSGAGLPGLPLAIHRPGVLMTLLEPRARRVKFLEDTVKVLALPNAQVMKGTVATVLDNSFDIATIRAVGDVGKVVGSARFLKEKGGVLAWTTQPERLVRLLSPNFVLEKAERVPGSSEKAIALYRKQGPEIARKD